MPEERHIHTYLHVIHIIYIHIYKHFRAQSRTNPSRARSEHEAGSWPPSIAVFYCYFERAAAGRFLNHNVLLQRKGWKHVGFSGAAGELKPLLTA